MGQDQGAQLADHLLPRETGSWIPVYEEAEGAICNGGSHQEEQPVEINFGNVLSGMLAIISGKARSWKATGDSEVDCPIGLQDEFVKSENDWVDVSSGQVDSRAANDSFTASIYVPSAPPPLPSYVSDVRRTRSLEEADPPQWMPDSSASTCMQCGTGFRPLTCGRHHCRFCGGLFCRRCSSGQCLMPPKFRQRDPQRVCDTCYELLEPIQRLLSDKVSNAAQIATHDVTDWTCMRAWLNNPLGLSMEQEIYKATNALRDYCKIGKLKPDNLIPAAVLQGAKGLAILTIVKAGMMITCKIGTGLIVARRRDGTWSAPSAIASCGIGWGAQVGGELTDFIIVLPSRKAIKAFCGRLHISIGAGLSAAAGPLGRAAEADIHAGLGGAATCYTYSCSKGAFFGVSLEGNVVTTQSEMNQCFYGDPYIKTRDILLGLVQRPKAAMPLYCALQELFDKIFASTKMMDTVVNCKGVQELYAKNLLTSY